MFFVGLGAIAMAATANTTIQLAVPDHLRGRTMSVYTTVFAGSTPVGGLLMGWIASRFGIVEAMVLGGVACAIVGFGAFAWVRRSRAETVIAARTKPWSIPAAAAGVRRPPALVVARAPLRSTQPSSRWALMTSLSCSTRLITLASCATDATWIVIATIAVWSGFTADVRRQDVDLVLGHDLGDVRQQARCGRTPRRGSRSGRSAPAPPPTPRRSGG